VFIITLLMAISVVFDVSERIDDFIKNEAPMKAIIFDYYLNFVIYYGNLFSALIIFIAVIWFTGKMSQRSEVVAILSSGVSYYRMLVPYFIAATILAGGALYANHFVIPKANKKRLDFEEDYIRNPFRLNIKNIHREIEDDLIIYFNSFNSGTNRGYNFSMETWEGTKLKKKLLAETATYNSETGKWKVDNYYIRTIMDDEEILETGKTIDTLINFKPEDLGQRLSVASALPYHELNEFIRQETKKGSENVIFYEIEKHQRTSYPLATYVLTLIGVAIASRKTRGGIGMYIALGLLTVGLYIFSMRMTTVAATNAGFDPLIAVWIPNIIFGIVSIIMIRNTPK
jgi:lipopolysaccharide export system permease protein